MSAHSEPGGAAQILYAVFLAATGPDDILRRGSFGAAAMTCKEWHSNKPS